MANNSIDSMAKELLNSIQESNGKKTSAYDTVAQVVRIDRENGVAWIHIPGGVDETPASLTVDAKVGDTVQVRVAGGRAWLTGNGTRPPTDDATAIAAKSDAQKAVNEAEYASQSAVQAAADASAARAIADDTNQHFWMIETGTDTGAHITEVTKEEFLDDPTGGNLLARSTGLAARDGLTEMATFSAGGIRIGKESETDTNMQVLYNCMRIRKGSKTYAYIGALNDETGMTRVRYRSADFNTDSFTVDLHIVSVVSATYEGGTDVDVSVSDDGYTVTVDNRERQILILVYDSDDVAPVYELGVRASGSARGHFSFLTGHNNSAPVGQSAAVGGRRNTAGGVNSVTIGGNSNAISGINAAIIGGHHSISQGYSQVVMGHNNVAQGTTESSLPTDDAFIIGNGSENAPSNAFVVKWNGDISRYTGWNGSSTPPANNEKNYEALDTSGRWIGRVSSIIYGGSSSRSGQVGTLIRARHPSAPNSPNTIGIYVDDNGAMDYTISSPANFRSALGIAVAVTGIGSSNGWVWRKYSDKTFDAWYSGTATTAINSAVGSLYQSGSNLSLAIPSEIGATSVLYGDVNMITSSYGVWAYILTMNSTTISYRGMSALSRASASYTVKAYIRGAYS